MHVCDVQNADTAWIAVQLDKVVRAFAIERPRIAQCDWSAQETLLDIDTDGFVHMTELALQVHVHPEATTFEYRTNRVKVAALGRLVERR